MRYKRFYRFFLVFSLSILGSSLISSCGSFNDGFSYEPLNRQTQRRITIEKYIQNQFTENQQYINIDFGDEYIIKPKSFRTVDSLYKVKYEESHYGGLTRAREIELGEQIDQALSKVLKDTALFKYEINHVFALRSEDSVKIISGVFLLNAKDSVEKVSIDFQLKDQKKYLSYFVEFLKHQSFLYDQYNPGEAEKKLYDFFEKELDRRDGALRKGAFIGHLLHVMAAANVQKTLSTEPIIKQLVVNLVTKYVASYKSIAWSSVKTELDDNNQLIGYLVQHEWNYTDSKGNAYHLKRQFTLNPYFEIIQVNSIDDIGWE